HDLIFLILDHRRRWLIQAEEGKTFHTHRGIVHFDDIIGKPFGTTVFSRPHKTAGFKFYVLKPLPTDYVLHMGRKTQIIYPEDAGLILVYSGIGPGKIVVEAGTGSGALSCILGNFVRPMGHIYSYDIREKSLRRARENVKKAHLEDIITIRQGDILSDEIQHEFVDAVVLDMPSPWEAVDKVKDFLKLSGSFVSFSPTIEQVKKTTSALYKSKEFIEINTNELMKRTYQVKKNATRPQTRMIGHTGFITFARKVKDMENPYKEIKPKKKEFVDLEGMPLRGSNTND
ncbi:MAG: tRNA (adenine-N1)-methyltransferase, partial [Promethearchaeota archaeon]